MSFVVGYPLAISEDRAAGSSDTRRFLILDPALMSWSTMSTFRFEESATLAGLSYTHCIPKIG
jgi:hypothetical protein